MRKYFFGWLLGWLLLGVFPASFAMAGEVEIVLRESCDTENCADLPVVNEKYLGFESSLTVGQEVSLDVIVKNPNEEGIYSVSSWLKYDKTVFRVKNMNGEKSAFPLVAPGEFEVNAENGEIKIGRAVLGTPISTKEMYVATITLEVLKNPKGSVLAFFDYQKSGIGKTSVLTIANLITKNLLLTEPRSLQFLQGPLKSSAPSPSSSTSPKPSPVVTLEPIPPVPSTIPNIPEYIDIPRPEGFRARTDETGKLEFLWKFGEDPRIAGYYLYYDEMSGSYIQRKDVGRTNYHGIPAGKFEKGKRYYFAIRAYDAKGKLSDFSDEAYVVAGIPGSESHPFYGVLAVGSQNLSLPNGVGGPNASANITQPQKKPVVNPNKNAETGPFEGVFFIFMISGVVLVLLAFWKVFLQPVLYGRQHSVFGKRSP